MDWTEFAQWGRHVSDWAQDYHLGVRDRPVRARTKPGEIFAQLPETPPEDGEEIGPILEDFERIVMPGITHWQHPRFFAYFTADAAPASVLAEFLVAAISPNCLLWQTSPAGTEMETRMMDWLRQAIDLPEVYSGVIQDSASSATLAAVLTMRERALDWAGNREGLPGQPVLRIYCSQEVHSSIDRAIWVAGIGQANLVKIPGTGPRRAIDIDALRTSIRADREAGLVPAGVIAVTGATGMGASDDLAAVAEVAREENLYSHLDAAWAGSAMICPEYRDIWAGAGDYDSVVFNPHKWLGAQFDCTAHFLRDPDALRQTLAIRPEYLKTSAETEVTDYSEWSIPLGRRFRALKLWFLLRAYGLEGLRQRIRNHVTWSQALCERMRAEPGFEIVTEPVLSLWTFRHDPGDGRDMDAHQQALVDAINDDGRTYLTQTVLDGRKVIRFQAGEFETTEGDLDIAFDAILDCARQLARAGVA